LTEGIGVDTNRMVMLELSRRNELGSGNAVINRIPLHVTNITINTSKTVPNMGVPLSGAIRGESLNIAFDMGLAQKTINLTGVLLEQNISKQNESGEVKNVSMTSFELMQLLHSYVDSSSLQDDQNISKILFFYPSRVDNKFVTRSGHENTALEDLPIIPFTWKNRAYDNNFTFGTGNEMDNESTIFNNSSAKTGNYTGITGFVRSFNTTIEPAEFPSIGFTLDFEEAKVIGDNFFD
tara:strand:- start:120 stop:830 length:711 start_codon:yes stop_codon:yes gene_type:complete